MTPPVQDSPQQRLVIKRIPFDSPISSRLISALDVEQELLHPGWENFPYAGPGNWLVGDPETNIPVTGAVVASGSPSSGQSSAVHKASRDQVCTFAAFVCAPDEEASTAAEASYTDENAVGCIGVKLINDTLAVFNHSTTVNGGSTEPARPVKAQVKRLYVEPAYRGHQEKLGLDRSVAQMLLEAVECFAQAELAVKLLLVETGVNQKPALKFYQRNGYTRCADFGEFVGAGEDVGGLSRCFEKRLL